MREDAVPFPGGEAGTVGAERDREAADFITYWAPPPRERIRRFGTHSCAQQVTYSLRTGRVTRLHDLYSVFVTIRAADASTDLSHTAPTPTQRFHVVEWGGSTEQLSGTD